MQATEDQETASPSNLRSYTQKVLPTELPRHEPNKSNSDMQATVDMVGRAKKASTLHEELQATVEG